MRNTVFVWSLLSSISYCLFATAMPCDETTVRELKSQVGVCEAEGAYQLAENYAATLQICYEDRENWHDVARLYYRRAYFATERSKWEQVQQLSDKAEKIAQTHRISFSSDEMAFIWSEIAHFCHTRLNNYEKAKRFYSKAITVDSTLAATTQDDDYFYYLGIDYQNLAALLGDEGDYEQAVQYYQKALTYLDSLSVDYAYVLLNLAYDYQHQKDFKRAAHFYEKTIQLEQNLYERTAAQEERSEIRNNQITTYHNYATFLNRVDSVTRAEQILMKIESWLPKDDTLLQSDHHMILGGILVKQKKFSEAKDYWFSALRLRKSLAHPPPNYLSDCYRDIATHLFVAQDSLTQALKFYDLAIAALQHEHPKQSLPSLIELNTDKLRLLTLLTAKARVLAQLQHVAEARDLFDYAMNLVDDIRLHYQGVTSKYYLLETVMPLYEDALRLALTNNKIDRAFTIAERSKANILLEQNKKVEAAAFANISIEILQQERDFKEIIASYERLLAESGDAEERATYQALLFEKRRAYQAFITHLETQYPTYHKLKYQVTTASISDIRAAVLDDETAMLEYFVGEQSVYLFVLTKDDLTAHTFPKTANFEQQIQTFRQTLTKPDATFATFQAYAETAWQIYHQYVQIGLKGVPKKVIVVPDGTLHYVPFQTLLRNVPASMSEARYDQLPYLVYDYQFSYAYSATLLLAMQKEPVQQSHFGGFAPVFQNSPAITQRFDPQRALPHSKREIEAIQTLWKGKSFLNEAANLQQFRTSLTDFSVLHLATHASVNDEQPNQSRIYFADDYLTLEEIYSLSLHADLTILSACETGVGSLQSGEGLLSLSRAFMYAGCPSLVTSLWQVNDETTADLMLDFHTAIRQSLPKDEALQQAQLTYLDRAASAVSKHPFYWAAFVHIGNTQALPTTSAAYYWLVGTGTLVILFSVYLFLKKPSVGRIFSSSSQI